MEPRTTCVTTILVGLLGAASAHADPIPIPSPVAAWGSSGTLPGQFHDPAGVAIDANGAIYVVDNLNHRVQVFSSDGAFRRTWGSLGSGPGEFNYPIGVAVGPDFHVYVVDKLNSRIAVFDTLGTFLHQWGTLGSLPGQLNGPHFVALDSDGDIYVTDSGNHRIQVFTSTGGFLRAWGAEGAGDGQFVDMRGIALDSANRVYVADWTLGRIQRFTRDGAFQLKWGTWGFSDTTFYTVYALHVDSHGYVYASDPHYHRVKSFTPDGQLLCVLGGLGTGSDQLNIPTGIATTSGFRIVVGDAVDQHIQVFEPLVDTLGFTISTYVTGHGSIRRSRTKWQYPTGSPVTLTATAEVGDRFVSWEGDTSSTDSVLTLTLTRDVLVGARFERDPALVPVLVSCGDRPDDQGGYARLVWARSPLDDPGVSTRVIGYRLERRPNHAIGGSWSSVGMVAASAMANYQADVRTLSNAALTDTAVSRYRVVAVSNQDSSTWTSNENTAASVDNLAPPAPVEAWKVVEGNHARLMWPSGKSLDFDHYSIYRAANPISVPDTVHRIGITAANEFVDETVVSENYWITQSDIHGNESPLTEAVQLNVTSSGSGRLPTDLTVGLPVPSPMAGRVAFTVGLPSATALGVDIMDVQGRVVRQLGRVPMPAGYSTWTWDGSDARGRPAQSGVYFVSVSSEHRKVSRRFVKTR